jgi:hypothetical protein
VRAVLSGQNQPGTHACRLPERFPRTRRLPSQLLLASVLGREDQFEGGCNTNCVAIYGKGVELRKSRATIVPGQPASLSFSLLVSIPAILRRSKLLNTGTMATVS